MTKNRQQRILRKARKRNPGLLHRTEDLENRVMLSGLTALSDQVTVRQFGGSIELDVLSNDSSDATGKLTLVTASVSTVAPGGSGSGIPASNPNSSGGSTSGTTAASVKIVRGTTNATGILGRDRVALTTTSTSFSGMLYVTYTVRDSLGRTATTTATTNVTRALAGGTFANASDGALIERGGTAHGYAASPTQNYIATNTGSFRYSQNQSGKYSQNVGGMSPTGTQNISKTVTSSYTSFGNWSYSEVVTWSYDVIQTSGADYRRSWGGYTSTFTNVSVAGVITTTLAFVSLDNLDGNKTTNSPGQSFATRYWGTNAIQMTNINVNDVLDSGSFTYSATTITGSSGSGTYSRSLPGGSLSGTLSSSSASTTTTMASIGFSQLVTMNWTASGLMSQVATSNSEFSSIGSGSYGDANFSGITSESGLNKRSSFSGVTGAYAIGTGWTMTGTGFSTESNNNQSNYNGSGSKTTAQDGGFVTTITASSGNTSSSGTTTVNYIFANNNWKLTTGVGLLADSAYDKASFSSNGNYVRTTNIDGGTSTVSGKTSSSGLDEKRRSSVINGTYTNSGWIVSGSGSASGKNDFSSHYEDSGIYTRNLNGGIVSGSSKADGKQETHSEYSSISSLSGGVWTTKGSGSASGLSHAHSQYSGSGTYTRTVSGMTYTGKQNQDGHNTQDNEWKTSTILAANGVATTSGSASGKSDHHNNSSFSGSGTYSRVIDAANNGVLSGSKNENRDEYSSGNATTSTTIFIVSGLAGGGSVDNSVTTGSAFSRSSGSAHTDWKGSANFTYSSNTNDGTTSISRTVTTISNESGSIDSKHDSKNESRLLNAVWQEIDGSGTASGSDMHSGDTTVTFTYQKTVSGAGGYQAKYSGGGTNTSKQSGSGKWDSASQFTPTGWQTISGNSKDTSEYFDKNDSSGSGTYSSDGGAYRSHMSGKVSEESHSQNSGSATVIASWVVDAFKITSGTRDATWSGNTHTDYEGTGKMGSAPATGGGANSSGEAEINWTGTVDENGYTNGGNSGTSKETWDPNLTASGSGSGSGAVVGGWKYTTATGSASGDTLKHYDFSGTGSYSSSGTDARHGKWSVSGTTTTNGKSDQFTKWDTTSGMSADARSVDLLGGKSKEWGNSEVETSFQASGSWSRSFLGFSANGKMTQSGKDKNGNDWEVNSTLDIAVANSQPNSSGNAWKETDGFDHNVSHSESKNRFDEDSHNFTSGPDGSVTGKWTDYMYTETIDDSEDMSKLDVSPNATERWKLVSGKASSTEISGSGGFYEGSGTIFRYGDGWSFLGKASNSGFEETGVGVTVLSSVNGSGSWVTDSAVGAIIAKHEYNWSHSGSGTSIQNGISGTFQQSGSYQEKSAGLVNTSDGISFSGKSTYDQQERSDESYKASGWTFIGGTSGTYQTSGSSYSSLTTNAVAEWDNAKNGFVVVSGKLNADSKADSEVNYSGSGTNSTLGGGSITTDLEIYSKYNGAADSEFNVVANPNPNDGKDYNPWKQSVGNLTSTSAFKSKARDRSSSTFDAGNGITGTYSSDYTNKSDSSETVTLKFLPAGGSAAGKWDITGTSKDQSDFEGGWTEVASGNYTLSDGSGSLLIDRAANGKSNATLNGKLNLTLDDSDQATSSAAIWINTSAWVTTGTMTISGDGHDNSKRSENRSWSAASPVGTNMSGSSTYVIAFNSNYNFSADKEYKANTWKLSNGSGAYHEDGNEQFLASATGSYTFAFGDGGTANGTATSKQDRGYNYIYDETWTADIAAQNWVVDVTGSGDYHNNSSYKYSATGSYSKTTPIDGGSSTVSGSITEGGFSKSEYNGKYSFFNKDYTEEQHWLSQSDSSSTLVRDTSSSWSITSSVPGGSTTSSGSSKTHEEVTSVSNSNSKTDRTDKMTNGILTWQSSGSGSSMSKTDGSSMSNTASNGNTVQVNGSSKYTANWSYTNNTASEWHSISDSKWQSSSSSDGSSFYSMTSGSGWSSSTSSSGTSSSSYQMTTTVSSTPIGGSGSGGTGSYSIGNSYSFSWSSSFSSGSPYSSQTYSKSTPATITPGTPTPNVSYRVADFTSGGTSEGSAFTELWKPNSVSITGLGKADLKIEQLGNPIADKLNKIDFIETVFVTPFEMVGEFYSQYYAMLGDAANAFGEWLTTQTGVGLFADIGKAVGDGLTMYGQFVGGMIKGIPSVINAGIDMWNNSSTLDKVQGALTVLGFVPIIGAAADLANAGIYAYNGDALNASLSLASAVPGIGDLAAGAKVVAQGVKSGDKLLDIARGLKCVATKAGCFVAGTEVLLSGIPGERVISQHVSGNTLTMAPPRLVAIEQVQLGSRVLTKNPKPWEYDASLPEPDPQTWVTVSLTVQRSDGAVVDMELLRPDWWLTEHHLDTGSTVDIHVEELGISGLATILSIAPCPAIASGEGSVVTALFKTRVASELARITLADGTQLSGTPVHPVWSLDRNDWVSLGDLVEGENLATELGPISVSSLELYRTTEPVYNFETHGEHVYQVTQLGLLVHNACPKGVRGAAKKQGGVYVWKKNGEVIRTGRTKDLVRRAKEHAKKLKELGATMETVFKTNSRNIQRGLAHILNQKHNARLDKVREIASRNPNMSTYVRAARDFLRRQG